MTMRRYGLVGTPITHSPSPAMHNAAFRARGLEARYELRPADVGEAEAVVAELRDGTFQGFNVTTPLKTVLASAAELADDAARAGAVNTLWIREGRLVGALTDVEGVREPLAQAGVAGGVGLVLGAGGASRAAVLALESLGCQAVVAARRPAHAAAMLSAVAARDPAAVIELGDEAVLARTLARATAVVQATPLGRGGEWLALPWDAARSGLVVLDMIYRPRRTPFLVDAARAGATTLEGWQMLLAQGARSFALWTEEEPPTDVMRAALLAALAEPVP